MGGTSVFAVSFFGAAVEVIEMVIIIVGVGAGAGVLARRSVERIPRSALQLVVGTLLTSFGTFWSVQGLNVSWPGGDVAILVLIGWYVLTASVYVRLIRQHERPYVLEKVS